MRKIVLLATVLVLAVAMVPTSSHATHCKDVFILSGDDSVRDPVENTRIGGVNIGSATCTARPNNPDLPPTNYFTPGATKAWGAVSATASPNKPTGGTIKGVTATWVLNDLRGRWETQAVTIGTSSSITLTASWVDLGGVARSATITYSKAA